MRATGEGRDELTEKEELLEELMQLEEETELHVDEENAARNEMIMMEKTKEQKCESEQWNAMVHQEKGWQNNWGRRKRQRRPEESRENFSSG